MPQPRAEAARYLAVSWFASGGCAAAAAHGGAAAPPPPNYDTTRYPDCAAKEERI